MANKKEMVWQDRKRTIFGLPWSFTKYKLYPDKLVVESGLLNKKEDELRLYRVMDNSLERTLGQRIFGLGTIKLLTADKSSPELFIKRIKKSVEVRDQLSELVEKERKRNRVSGREYMGDFGDDADDDDY
jgi:uncharacterized membrane protein YdbT with pleckstrin-like domain